MNIHKKPIFLLSHKLISISMVTFYKKKNMPIVKMFPNLDSDKNVTGL